MSFEIDHAPGQLPVYGVDLIIKTSASAVLGVIVQDISNIEYTGERVTAKDGQGKDVARIYYNRDYKSFTLNCWPVGTDETEAIGVDTLFKHGTIIEVSASATYPALIGFWRVTQAQTTGSNTDKKMVSLSLEESIKKSWTP